MKNQVMVAYLYAESELIDVIREGTCAAPVIPHTDGGPDGLYRDHGLGLSGLGSPR